MFGLKFRFPGETARILAAARDRRDALVGNLVGEIFPNHPYQFDAALSFLQETPFEPADPVRVTLFFPKFAARALAIDILAPQEAEDFREAERFASREVWEKAQARCARKRSLLSRYGIPYLVITSHEPVDPVNLRERVKELTGRYP